MPGPVSQDQAALFGAIAGGEKKVKGFSAAEARDRLRGVSVKSLPQSAPKKSGIDYYATRKKRKKA